MNVPVSSPRMQRVEARGRIGVKGTDGITRLADLFQEGSAKIRFPRNHSMVPGNPLEAVLINTAGGLTGGDRVSWRAEARAGARLSLTTQACEKVYKADTGTAKTGIELTAGAGARIAWLPQETILFDRAAFARNMSVDLATDSECLIVEALLLGRKAMGETVRKASFHDRWRVRVDGRLVHAEDFRFDGDAADLFSGIATGDGGGAFATLLYVGEQSEALHARVRTRMDEWSANRANIGPDVRLGVSHWRIGQKDAGAGGGSGKLLARVVAKDGYRLRSLLQPLIALLNGKAGLPRIWST